MPTEPYVDVGEVTAPQGLDGSVRVFLTTDHPQYLVPGRNVWPDRMDAQPLTIVAFRDQGHIAVARFEGITDRTQAERLRGTHLLMPTGELPPLPDQSYYWHQLLGLTVREQATERVIGRVRHVLRTGAHDVLEVERCEAKPLLIPAVQAVIARVSLADGSLWVQLPTGLEEL